jgi:hypothetical protein
MGACPRIETKALTRKHARREKTVQKEPSQYDSWGESHSHRCRMREKYHLSHPGGMHFAPSLLHP